MTLTHLAQLGVQTRYWDTLIVGVEEKMRSNLPTMMWSRAEALKSAGNS